MTNARFSQTFTVRYHELDLHGRLKPVMLLNYLQDTAGIHARQLGISVLDLRKQGLTWVISRIHLAVQRYPRGDEPVTVTTWPSTRQGLFSCREFQLFDDSGTLLAAATSSWAVLDMATRRPVLPDSCLPHYPSDPERAVADDFASLPVLPGSDRYSEHRFDVLRSDLDSNRHVNNTVFVGWALEAAPEQYNDMILAELEISYRAEALYGDAVISRCLDTTQGHCIHQIINQTDGRELARLRSRWKALPHISETPEPQP